MKPIPYWWAVASGQIPAALSADLYISDHATSVSRVLFDGIPYGGLIAIQPRSVVEFDTYQLDVLHIDRLVGPISTHRCFFEAFEDEPRTLYLLQGDQLSIYPNALLRSHGLTIQTGGLRIVEDYELIYQASQTPEFSLQN